MSDFENTPEDLRQWTLSMLRDKIREQAKEIELLRANQATMVETMLMVGREFDLVVDGEIVVGKDMPARMPKP